MDKKRNINRMIKIMIIGIIILISEVVDVFESIYFLSRVK